MTHRITLIPGDGTGPEIVEATRRAIEATGVAIEWDVHDIGVPAMQKHGDPFPKSALDSIRRNKVGLKGPLTTELGKGFRSVNVALRKEFEASLVLVTHDHALTEHADRVVRLRDGRLETPA